MTPIKKFLLYPQEVASAKKFLQDIEMSVAKLSKEDRAALQKLLKARVPNEETLLPAIKERILREEQQMKEAIRAIKEGGALDESAHKAVRALTSRPLSVPEKFWPAGNKPGLNKKSTTSAPQKWIIEHPIIEVKTIFLASKKLKESERLLKKHFQLTPGQFFEQFWPFLKELEKKPTSARELSQMRTRDGYLFELLMSVAEPIRKSEVEFLATTVVKILGINRGSMEAARITSEIVTRLQDGVLRRLEFCEVAPKLWDISLKVVRDEGGKLVTDRLRGVLDFNLKNPEFTIYVIGESKLGKGYLQINKQLIRDIQRLLSEVNSNHFSVDNVKMKFAGKLLLVAQTEKPIPASHKQNIKQRVSDATGMQIKGDVTLINHVDAEGAAAARKIIKETYDVIEDLIK